VDLGALFDWLGMQGSSCSPSSESGAEVIEGSNVDIMYFQITGESARRLCAANHLPAFRGRRRRRRDEGPGIGRPLGGHRPL
jgi:hypothetical protein